MAELVGGTKPESPATAPGLGPEAVRRFVDLSAENELYYMITGSPKVYDAKDPAVESRFKKVVSDALASGEFIDPAGAKCKTPFWNDQTKLQLATDFLKRTIPDLSISP